MRLECWPLIVAVLLMGAPSWAAEDDAPESPAPEVPVTPEPESPEPARNCPFAVGTFTQNMENRVAYTTESGFFNFTDAVSFDETEVAITLKHALLSAWTCVTWDVELLLPDGIIFIDGQSAKLEDLTQASVAEFEVEVVDMRLGTSSFRSDMNRNELHRYKGFLSVVVFNGSDTPIQIDDKTDAQGRWHFPVTFIAHH